ncbi:zinc finger protein 665 [Lucilia sericata]|uniref:zinc finger protein 665 n=1 Tax=Lucilia sericata TaxID=13632 RepID=UPI0018A87DA8|nr:zinc finger protein 665 [Lucilia sericata]
MNTKKICRCCMVMDVPLLSIYDSGSDGMGCVADMLKQIAKLKPQSADKMPDKACLQCISEINRCYVFKMKCENANRTLRQIFPDAVPEPLDCVPKKVEVVSSAMQTENKILISSMVQTIAEEKPLLAHSSAQTINVEQPSLTHSSVQTIIEGKPLVYHKEIQTEYEIIPTDNSLPESIIIYEEIDNSNTNTKKRLPTSPLNKQVSKKTCLETRKVNNLQTLTETETNVQSSNTYILYEDSQADSNCSEVEELYIPSSEQTQKEGECNRFEYYENEIEDTQDEQGDSQLYQDNILVYNENFKSNSEYEIDISQTIEKSPQQSEEYLKSQKSTKASYKSKGQYKCSQCIMTFVSIKVLKRHLANRHDIKDAELIIDYLPTTETDETSQDVEQPSSSDNVTKSNISNIELTAENVPKPQLLPREKVTSSVNEELLTNMKYFCDYCQAGFAQRKTLTSHIKNQICMTSNFKCNKCERIFISEENLETHKLTHENPHKCLECDTVFKTIEELSEHMIENHNRNARNQCHVCKKVFTMKTSLMDHLRIHSGEKPFLCTICGKSFNQNSNLRQHLTRHNNEKNFKCDMCPNAYVTKAELFSHKRTHTGDQPFKCDICEARFTSNCSLKKHVRKHTGERPYACEFCPMRFAALNVLKNHRRIHTGEKPFKCNYCSKSFAQKGDCQIHQKTHVNNDFKCVCESKFSKKSNFRHHLKTQHPDFSEKQVQALLDKSNMVNDNEEEYQITLIDDSSEKFINSPSQTDDIENDGQSSFVTISHVTKNVTKTAASSASNDNEDFMEIDMEEM